MRVNQRILGNCTFCNPILFAIIDQQSGNLTVAWMTKPLEAHANASETDIFPIRLIGDDKYHQLAIIYDTTPLETGGSYQKTRIVRWNGQKFSEIWRHVW